MNDMRIVAPLLMLHRPAERAACLRGIAALLDSFREMRREFLVDIAIETIRAKNIGDARPQRHITPS